MSKYHNEKNSFIDTIKRTNSNFGTSLFIKRYVIEQCRSMKDRQIYRKKCHYYKIAFFFEICSISDWKGEDKKVVCPNFGNTALTSSIKK